jgi:hypothetical protein
VHVVVNHVRLRDPLTEETVQAARDGIRLVVDAGGSRCLPATRTATSAR